jgi:hypothetical protein
MVTGKSRTTGLMAKQAWWVCTVCKEKVLPLGQPTSEAAATIKAHATACGDKARFKVTRVQG